jgi:two-component system OmpR family response regulator
LQLLLSIRATKAGDGQRARRKRPEDIYMTAIWFPVASSARRATIVYKSRALAGDRDEVAIEMMPTPHLLIVDDDRAIRDLLTKFFVQHGYRVSVAAEGRAMLQVLQAARIDLIVLDVMLPGEDGLSLCRRLRADSTIPIIMLTAKGEDTDRIVGLEMGADDYLPKDFNPRELLSRVRAVLRRSTNPPAKELSTSSQVLEFHGWQIVLARRQLFSPAGALVPLRSGEYDLLLALVERPQRVLTRDQLLDLVRGRSANVFDRSIDVQISRLRRKIEADPKGPEFIKTVRSGGYVFAAVVTVTGAEL